MATTAERTNGVPHVARLLKRDQFIAAALEQIARAMAEVVDLSWCTPARWMDRQRKHVLQPGYDFGNEFDIGLGMVLDGIAGLDGAAIAPAITRSGRRVGHLSQRTNTSPER